MSKVTDSDGNEINLRDVVEHPVSKLYINMRGKSASDKNNLAELLSFYNVDYHDLAIHQQREIAMRVVYSRTHFRYPADVPISEYGEMIMCGRDGCTYLSGDDIPEHVRDTAARVNRAREILDRI